MKKIIIIDDEPLSRDIIKTYLKKFSNIEIVQECGDGLEGIKAIQQHQPDLLFLDIQMPKITGFEMLELLDVKPAVIFITAYDTFAIKAFESNAIDYLLKPISEDRLKKAFVKWENNLRTSELPIAIDPINHLSFSPAQQTRIVVKTGNKIKIIPVPDVIYIEAYDDYVKIHCQEGVFLKNKTMNFYEQTLDPTSFVRVHRSYILHINQITKIEPYQKETHLAILRNGTKIPVSKTGYLKLKSLLGI